MTKCHHCRYELDISNKCLHGAKSLITKDFWNLLRLTQIESRISKLYQFGLLLVCSEKQKLPFNVVFLEPSLSKVLKRYFLQALVCNVLRFSLIPCNKGHNSFSNCKSGQLRATHAMHVTHAKKLRNAIIKQTNAFDVPF